MKTLGKVLNVIGQILAVILVLALLLKYINDIYQFLPTVGSTILYYIVQYGATLLVGIIALGAIMRTNLIFTIIVIILIAAVVGFMFAGDILKGFLPSADSAAYIANIIA